MQKSRILGMVFGVFVISIMTVTRVQANDVATNCEKLQELDKISSNIDTDAALGLMVNDQMAYKLKQLRSILEPTGLDLSKFTADIQSLSVQKTKAEDSYKTYRAELFKTKELVCSSSASLKSDINELRLKFNAAKVAYQDYWNFVKSNIISDLSDIRAKL